MHGRALLALAAITIFAATALSGCAWLGKGLEVSDAYKKTNEAKSGAYKASLTISAPKKGRSEKLAEYYVASGAFDATDADHPKSRGAIMIDGESSSYVEPGNGRIYLTADGETDYFKIAKADRPEGQENGESIMDAIARSVVNFRDAPAVTNAVGAPIPAIAADISRAKLCGESMRAAARVINKSVLNDDEWKLHISKADVREITSWCSHQMPTAPSLTFGIDNGLLTDFALNGTVRDGKRTVAFELKLQFSGLNQPQDGFIPPKGNKKSSGIKLSAAAARESDRIESLIDSIPEF